MTRPDSTWFSLVTAALFLVVSASAQPLGGPAGGQGRGPVDPLLLGLSRKLGERFTEQMQSAVRRVQEENAPEMLKCRDAFARDVSVAFSIPVEKVTELLSDPGNSDPQAAPTPFVKRLSSLLGKHLDKLAAKRLHGASEKQAACARPWQEKLVLDVAAATGLPAREVEALVPWAATRGGPRALLQPGAPSSDGPGFFGSDYLERPLFVCAGTARPSGTESNLLPLMAANRDRFKGKTVLDLGTGSGIVALYAAQLGAARVVATDLEPRAIACTRENARRMNLERVVETRLVHLENPSAYAGIRPGEVFDIILSSPPSEANRAPSVISGSVDDGVTQNDNVRLGLSIVGGLRDHLVPDGVAVLFYPSDLLLPIMVSYARHLGHEVSYCPARQLQTADWHVLYNTFAAQVARTEHLAPAALLLPPSTSAPGDPDGGHYRALDFADKGLEMPRLWDAPLDRVLSGVIVIRNGPAWPGQTGPKVPH
ncbi:MAG: class I SAM-dependent methyltransferase [Candidatus Riflebacteria bacterium]|nr:class I SAM-dependent methyltransferase [Candidatus Riflebacteria bacterium]